MSGNSRVVVVDGGSRKVPDILEIVRQAGWTATLVPMSEMNGADFSNYEAMVISGGPHLFTDVDSEKTNTLRSYFQFLRHWSKPVLGICLGHQALALEAGAQVYRGTERRNPEPVVFDDIHPLLEGIPSGSVFAEDHCEGVSEPLGYRIIGHSEFYPVEVMVNDEKRRFGVQFHPEVSGEVGRRLLQNFFTLCRG